MFKNKKILRITIGILIAAFALTAIYFLATKIFFKPKMSITLSANRNKITALKPEEQIIRTVSYEQGKVLVLYMDYTILEPLDSQDLQVWIKTTGPEMLHIGSNVIAGMPVPTRDTQLSEANPGYLIADFASVPNTPGKKFHARFTEYFREKGTVVAQAEFRVNGKTVGKSNKFNIEVN